MHSGNQWHTLHVSRMRQRLLLHMRLLQPLQLSKMRNKTHIEGCMAMTKKKCPCDGCETIVEGISEFEARIRLLAHIAAKHPN